MIPFAIVENAGPAIFTVLSIAALAILGGYAYAYSAHLFLVVADATAGGADTVNWPDDPIVEQFGRATAMAWILLVTLAPSFLIAAALSLGYAKLLVPLMGLIAALVFPIVTMSVQSGTSMLTVIAPGVIARLMKRPDILMAYYLASAPVVAVGFLGSYILHTQRFVVLPIGAVLVAAVILTTARLYGRLAQRLSRVPIRNREKVVPEAKPFVPRPMPMPEIAQDNLDTDASYAVSDDRIVEPADSSHQSTLKRVWKDDDDESVPFQLADGPPPPPMLPESLKNPSIQERQLAEKKRPAEPPKLMWVNGTYSFPFRIDSLVRVLWMAIGFTVAAFFWQIVCASS